jgi:hypothetical protein
MVTISVQAQWHDGYRQWKEIASVRFPGGAGTGDFIAANYDPNIKIHAIRLELESGIGFFLDTTCMLSMPPFIDGEPNPWGPLA